MTELPDFWRTEIWHPLSVHFPLAILFLGSLLVVISLLLKKSLFGSMAYLLLVLGTLGAWAAIYTGNLADPIVSRQICDPTVLETHETNAYVVGWIFTLVSAIIVSEYFGLLQKVKRISKIAIVVLSIVGSGFLVYTGHLGATLVYQQAAGVYVPTDDCIEFNN